MRKFSVGSIYEILKELDLINKKGVNVSLINSFSKRDIYETVTPLATDRINKVVSAHGYI